MVAKAQRRLRLGERLLGATAEAGDLDEGARVLREFLVDRARGQLEYGIEEAVVLFADLELRGVHADGEAADAGGHVVAGDRALVALGEFAVRIQRQGLRGDDVAGE